MKTWHIQQIILCLVVWSVLSCQSGKKTRIHPDESDSNVNLLAHTGKPKQETVEAVSKETQKETPPECQNLADVWYECIFEEDAKVVSLPDTSIKMGAKEPLATIQMFWSLFCPECSAVIHRSLPSLLTNRPADVQVQLAAMPLLAHDLDMLAMEIAYEVRAQKGDEAFWKFLQHLHQKPESFYIQERLLTGETRKEVMANFEAKCATVQLKPLIDLLRLCDKEHTDCAAFEKCVQTYYSALQQGKTIPSVQEEKPTCAKLSAKRFDCLIKDQVFDIPVEGSPQFGNADALATIVVFSDFECPHCYNLAKMLGKLAKKLGPKLRIVYKNYPLTYHKEGQLAARLGAEVFAHKGSAEFFRFHDLVFDNQEKLSRDWLMKTATSFGLKETEAAQILDSHDAVPRIEYDVQLGNMLQVSGTPTAYLNGVLMRIADETQLEKMVKNEISRVEQLFPRKNDRKNVYMRIVQPGRDRLMEMAKAAGLDMKKLEIELKTGKHRNDIEAERKVGMRDCRSMPCLFINGRRVDADPVPVMTRFFDDAQFALRNGVMRSNLYVHLSAAKGLMRILTADTRYYDVEVFDFTNACAKPTDAWMNWMPSFLSCAKTAQNCAQYQQCVQETQKKVTKP